MLSNGADVPIVGKGKRASVSGAPKSYLLLVHIVWRCTFAMVLLHIAGRRRWASITDKAHKSTAPPRSTNTITLKLPIDSPLARVEAAESLGGGLSLFAGLSTMDASVGSLSRLILMELLFLQLSGSTGVFEPETKLTAAHFGL